MDTWVAIKSSDWLKGPAKPQLKHLPAENVFRVPVAVLAAPGEGVAGGISDLHCGEREP